MSKSEDAFLAATIIISTVGLLCNALSFSFFIKRRRELGNALLAYMNIVDMIVSLAVFLYFSSFTTGNVYVMMVLVTISSHTFRSSMLVTGLLTIYLNILRTAAIIWPMFRFKRRIVQASLIALIIVFVGVETSNGVLYTYPSTVYLYKTEIGENASLPFPPDHPFVQFTYYELQIFGIPIVFLVAVCCTVSAVKLLLPDKTLHETKERSGRINAAITVLIIGVQYVVWNTIGLTLWTMCAYYSLHGRESEDYVMKLLLWGNTSLIVNSAVNPVVYICRVKKLRDHIAAVAKCYCLRRSRVAEQRVSRSFRASTVWSDAADPRISQSVRESTF